MAGFTPEQLAVDDGALDDFQKLLDRRAEVIAKIDAVTARIVQQEQDPSACSDKESFRRALLEAGTRLEGQNKLLETNLKISLDRLKKRGKELQEGRQSSRAYVPRLSAAEGSFIDKRR